MRYIILNSSKLVEGSNNAILRHQFPESVNVDDAYAVGMESATMFISIFTINAALYNNSNRFQYQVLLEAQVNAAQHISR